MRQIVVILSVAILVYTSSALADGLVKKSTVRSIKQPPETVTLKQGTGMEVARGYCAICHSLDYIMTQQKFTRAKWHTEVTKMATHASSAAIISRTARMPALSKSVSAAIHRSRTMIIFLPVTLPYTDRL